MAGNNNFLSGRGAVYVVSSDKSSKYSLKPPLPKGKENAACIITGYSLNETEITSKIACLNDQRVLYSFGKAFGEIHVSGELLLGEAGKTTDSSMEYDLRDYYDKNRVSKLDDSIGFSAGKTLTMDFFLTGLSIANYNLEFEILPFTLVGTLVK
jgi:hypothetical protein